MKGHTRERYITDLADRVGVLTAQINALSVELAAVVGAFDEEDGWGGGGYRSMSHWLGHRCGWSTSDAGRIARVGARLDSIPTLAAAADRGEVSLAMLDAAARVTTPDNEEQVAHVVQLCTPAQAGRVLGSYRKAKDAKSPGDCMGPEPDEADTAPLTESDFWWREWIDHKGRGRIDAAIDPATLDRLQQARAAYENNVTEPDEEAALADGADAPMAPRPVRPRRATPSEAFVRVADAAIELAEAGGKRDGSGERYVIQVTADLATLAAALGVELSSKLPVGLGNRAYVTGRNGGVRRLSDRELSEAVCNAKLQLLVEQDGVPLWLGNETRHATRHQRRALKNRCRNTCEFPGCTSRRYLEPHHVQFHTDGGVTAVENLVMLCWSHHHGLHQGDFEIQIAGHQVFGFYDRFGRCLGSNSVHGPQPGEKPIHYQRQAATNSDGTKPSGPEPSGIEPPGPRVVDPNELAKPECEAPDRHLRLVDPTIPRSTGGGWPLTYYGLDVLVTSLLDAG